MSFASFNASAPVGVYEIHCLEISHSSFLAPLRIYQPGYDPLAVTLEGGTQAVFEARSFTTKRPSVTDSGRISRSLQIDGVDGALRPLLRLAAQSQEPMLATMRIYLSNDLSAPQFDPPEQLVLGDVSLNNTSVGASAENDNIINKRFPAAIYTTENTPGLRR